MKNGNFKDHIFYDLYRHLDNVAEDPNGEFPEIAGILGVVP